MRLRLGTTLYFKPASPSRLTNSSFKAFHSKKDVTILYWQLQATKSRICPEGRGRLACEGG